MTRPWTFLQTPTIDGSDIDPISRHPHRPARPLLRHPSMAPLRSCTSPAGIPRTSALIGYPDLA